MDRQITLQQQTVKYILKFRSRARNLRLAISGAGQFIVTAPNGLSADIIERFIISRSQWVLNGLAYFKNLPIWSLMLGNKETYLACREAALSFAQKRVDYFNQSYGFQLNKIRVGNQRTRWGSCSAKGNLNFNYRIIFLPVRLADYIVVHELCHLRELNHSANFWKLVAQTTPDYLKIRRELKGRPAGT